MPNFFKQNKDKPEETPVEEPTAPVVEEGAEVAPDEAEGADTPHNPALEPEPEREPLQEEPEREVEGVVCPDCGGKGLLDAQTLCDKCVGSGVV